MNLFLGPIKFNKVSVAAIGLYSKFLKEKWAKTDQKLKILQHILTKA
jgi:hypothetical protein